MAGLEMAKRVQSVLRFAVLCRSSFGPLSNACPDDRRENCSRAKCLKLCYFVMLTQVGGPLDTSQAVAHPLGRLSPSCC